MIFSQPEQLADIPLERATYAALDIETTGISPWTDRIVEIGVVRWSASSRAAEFQDIVNPEIPIKPGASRIHGIKQEDVETAPRFRDIAEDLLEELEGAVIVAHKGIAFDIPFVNAELARAGKAPLCNVVVDTGLLFKTPWLQSLGRSLSDMAKATGVKEGERHRALPDARLVLRVWIALLEGFADFGKHTLLDVLPYFKMPSYHRNAVELFKRARQNRGKATVLYPSGRSLKPRQLMPLFTRRDKVVAVENPGEGFKEFQAHKMVFRV